MSIQPHSAFQYIRADEVAECWDHVGKDLYAKLWEIVPRQREIPNIEDSGPADHVGHENLASFWHLFSDEEKLKLNDVAVRNER